jgi:hypothetical protein
MSESARYHAREWASDKTIAEIKAEITRLEQAPEWKGHEFDDQRMRHMRATTIRTLKDLVAARTIEGLTAYTNLTGERA